MRRRAPSCGTCSRSITTSPSRAPARRASIKGKVVIGNAGGEFGVRGYISAYDAETGKLAWRFYTVPGNPADPVEAADPEDRREDLERQLVGTRRRRHGVGWHRLRPEAEPRLLRHRQRLAVESRVSRLRRRRQSFPRFDHRGERRYRRVRVALPAGARRSVGLRRHFAAHARGPEDRR